MLENYVYCLDMHKLSDSSWLGHSSFIFIDKSTKHKIYYIDPINLKNKKLKKADLVFITHNHPDHLSFSDIQLTLKGTTIVIAPSSCLDNIALPDSQKFPVTPNNLYSVKNLSFQTLPAYNLHQDKKTYHPKNNDWVGYIFELNNKLIYHAGDTDYIPEMKELHNLHLDLAFLPIGGIYTMDAYEAIDAANSIAARFTIPIHYKQIPDENYKKVEQIFKKGVTKSEVILLKETR